MTNLFSSTPDRDGDYVDVETYLHEPGKILITAHNSSENAWASAFVTGAEVIKLRDLLSKLIGDTSGFPTPPAEPHAPVTEDRVRQLIAEALAAPRPLHEAPQAVIPDLPPEELCHRTQPLLNVHAAIRCTFCGFLWTDHPTVGEVVAKATAAFGEVAARLSAPKQLVGCKCGHRWATHLLSFGCDVTGCDCLMSYPTSRD